MRTSQKIIEIEEVTIARPLLDFITKSRANIEDKKIPRWLTVQQYILNCTLCVDLN
jgi:hypothetical protein